MCISQYVHVKVIEFVSNVCGTNTDKLMTLHACLILPVHIQSLMQLSDMLFGLFLFFIYCVPIFILIHVFLKPILIPCQCSKYRRK